MAQLSKRVRAIRERVERGKLYPAEEAFALLKEVSQVKFAESIDVSVNLGVDPRKSDQVVRGSTVLPHGIGKTVRVAVFAQGAAADAAAEAGADGSVSRIWPRNSRPGSLTTTSSSPRPTRCESSDSSVRSWVPVASCRTPRSEP